MVELWKVKREVLRILSQINNRFLPIFEWGVQIFEWFAQKRYDANFSKLTQLINGQKPVTKKVAVFFIYQPLTLAKSVLVTCDFLLDQGYSILLVSSTPLSAPDLQAVQDVTWKVLLRPNYGYDFGGYRDGFRVLSELNVQANLVLIMNDSMWMPLSDNCQMIKKMEEENLCLTGPIFESFVKLNKRTEYFQSYLTLVKSEVLQSSAFKNYWRNYRVSSRKKIVLVRGEEGFSLSMFKAGFGGGNPSTRAVLFGLLQNQSNSFLLKTLSYATYVRNDLLIEARNLIQHYSDTDEWRTVFLLHIKKVLASTQLMGALPYASIKLLGLSFLKKSSFPREHDGMRWQYLRAVKNGDLPAPHPVILAEITASKMNPSLTTDPSFPPPISTTKAK